MKDNFLQEDGMVFMLFFNSLVILLLYWYFLNFILILNIYLFVCVLTWKFKKKQENYLKLNFHRSPSRFKIKKSKWF